MNRDGAANGVTGVGVAASAGVTSMTGGQAINREAATTSGAGTQALMTYSQAAQDLKERMYGSRLTPLSAEATEKNFQDLTLLMKVFVMNRVQKILQLSHAENWRWVSTHQNPADVLSRGATMEELLAHELWWEGPRFLVEGEVWPEQPPSSRSTALALEELKDMPSTPVLMAVEVEPALDRRFPVLLRVFDAVRRFKQGCRAARENPEAALPEWRWRRAAFDRLVSRVQEQVFPQERAALRKGEKVPKGSRLSKLDLYFDQERDLIRLDGRVRHCHFLLEDVRSPPILPGEHPWALRYVQHVHEVVLRHEGGRHHLASAVSRAVWVIGLTKAARDLCKKCTECRSKSAVEVHQRMAPIPEHRLGSGTIMLPAFATTGVDYTGAIEVKMGRCRAREKRYWVLFTCTQYRAVHIEVLRSLDSDEFLMAFERFTARRGVPKVVISDNGGNFVKGQRELRELRLEWASVNKNSLVERYPDIEWRFNTPLTPHCGGIFERLIKSSKLAFASMCQRRTPTEVEFHTLSTNVEAVLNSRPLVPRDQEEDGRDPEALTPAHFLGAGAPYEDLAPLGEEDNLAKRWQGLQHAKQYFWTRFIKEVVPRLQGREKWRHARYTPQVGEVVLLLEDKARGHWPLARVLEVYHSGADGLARMVLLKYRGKELKRPVQRVIPLEPFRERSTSSPGKEESA